MTLRDRPAGALLHPDDRPQLEATGFDVVPTTPEGYSQFQRAEIDRWRDVVRRANITAG